MFKAKQDFFPILIRSNLNMYNQLYPPREVRVYYKKSPLYRELYKKSNNRFGQENLLIMKYFCWQNNSLGPSKEFTSSSNNCQKYLIAVVDNYLRQGRERFNTC